MERNKQADINREHQFSEYTAVLRKQRGVTQEQLCEGLCSLSQMTKMEQGDRKPDRPLQDRLLERLGVAPYDYENLLAKPEYDRWLKRQHIQQAIRRRNWDSAANRLEQYRQEYGRGNSLEEQYYLSMLAQVKKNDGSWNQEELLEAYEGTVRLTIPGLGRKPLSELVLSAQELNLILEYAHYCDGINGSEMIEEVLRYIEHSWLDETSKAKLYPKAVYFLWEYNKKMMQAEEGSKFLEMCDRGIELLRDEQFLYYMWELLGMRQEIWNLAGIPGGDQKREQETENWKNAIEKLYQEYGIPTAMYEYCYLYEENEVYCIGDVIRVRRNMLSMERKRFYDGVCDARTLRRIERNETKPQKEIAEKLLERLNLPTEYYRTELRTKNWEARQFMRKLRKVTNQCDVQRMGALINRIEKLIPMEDAANRQVIARYKLLREQKARKISKEEYLRKMVEVLEMTLPLESALAEGEKYMTNEEVLCIQNLARNKDLEDEQTGRCIKTLKEFYGYFETEDMVGPYINMYETVMCVVASYLGDRGEYEESNAISRRILRDSLLCRRAVVTDNCLYNIFWNGKEQQKKTIPHHRMRNTEEGLRQCLTWATFTKDLYGVFFYEEEMNKLKI